MTIYVRHHLYPPDKPIKLIILSIFFINFIRSEITLIVLLAKQTCPRHYYSMVCLFSDSDLRLTTALYATSYWNIINSSSMSTLYEHAIVIGLQIRAIFVYCKIRIMTPCISCMLNIAYLFD